jgi:hypothetical protein
MNRYMTCTSSLYARCHELFAGYPLTIRAHASGGRTVRSMVLMLRSGDDACFFVLSDRSDDKPGYSIRSWPVGRSVDIADEGSSDVPDVARDAVSHGIPIPRDGSLFGWSNGDSITALVAVYAMYTPASPQPSWTVMPLAGIPRVAWPPFVYEHFLGCWFWEHQRAGNIISLSDLIAATPNAVFWVDTKAVLGSDCCAVMHDIDGPGGHTLRQGRYVYYGALQAGKPVPSLSLLLADATKIDLSLRFQPSGH